MIPRAIGVDDWKKGIRLGFGSEFRRPWWSRSSRADAQQTLRIRGESNERETMPPKMSLQPWNPAQQRPGLDTPNPAARTLLRGRLNTWILITQRDVRSLRESDWLTWVRRQRSAGYLNNKEVMWLDSSRLRQRRKELVNIHNVFLGYSKVSAFRNPSDSLFREWKQNTFWFSSDRVLKVIIDRRIR